MAWRRVGGVKVCVIDKLTVRKYAKLARRSLQCLLSIIVRVHDIKFRVHECDQPLWSVERPREMEFLRGFSSFFFRIVSNLNTLKTLTLLVHSGLRWSFYNPPSSDMDNRIFNVCVSFFCMCIHTGDLGSRPHSKCSCRVKSVHGVFLHVYTHGGLRFTPLFEILV